jgi:hypothetical protein
MVAAGQKVTSWKIASHAEVNRIHVSRGSARVAAGRLDSGHLDSKRIVIDYPADF